MRTYLTLFLSLLLTWACSKTDRPMGDTPNPKTQRSYKISVDSLKKQAVAIGEIFGSAQTKGRATKVSDMPLSSIATGVGMELRMVIFRISTPPMVSIWTTRQT